MVSRVESLYQEGMTQIEVARDLGVGEKVIWNLMRRHGIKARTAAKRNQWGEANTGWKGSGASYSAMHQRLYKRFGKPDFCQHCGRTTQERQYDWASLGNDLNDIHDYIRLCRSCHTKYDGKVKNLGVYAIPKRLRT